MARREGTLKLSSNIEPRAAAPLDARTIVPTLAELTASGTFSYPYVGMIVSVQSEGKAYMLTAADTTSSTNWTELNVDDAFKKIYTGSSIDWNLLSTAEKTEYDFTAFSDEDEAGVETVVDVVQNGNMHAVSSNAVYGIMPKYSKVTGSGTINVYTTLTEEPSVFIDVPAGKMCLVVGTAVYNTAKPLACAISVAGTVATDTFSFVAYSPDTAHCLGFYKNETANTVRLTLYTKYEREGTMGGEYNTIEVIWLN